MTKKILLIGGAGFIGHNLALYLKKKKYKIYILDNLEINNLKYVKNIKDNKKRVLYKKFIMERLHLLKKNKILLKKVNATDKQKLKKEIEKINPNFIIHLAAVAHDGRSNVNPEVAFKNSFQTLFNVLEVIKNKNNIHFIFMSSSMVYGNFKKKTVDEKDECNPIGIYGSLKLAAELLIKSYSNVFSLKYTIVRPSALYGERCISNRVIQVFLESAFEKKDININGDGKENLDFTYIGDLCQGIYKIIRNQHNSINQTFNLTFGNSKSILHLKKLVLKKFIQQKFLHFKRDKLMAIRGTLSIKKAKKLLNYKPNFKIDKGFSRYYLWYKKSIYGRK